MVDISEQEAKKFDELLDKIGPPSCVAYLMVDEFKNDRNAAAYLISIARECIQLAARRGRFSTDVRKALLETWMVFKDLENSQFITKSDLREFAEQDAVKLLAALSYSALSAENRKFFRTVIFSAPANENG